jgi:integrative and conjugative element protein (TIGR02256 family)
MRDRQAVSRIFRRKDGSGVGISEAALALLLSHRQLGRKDKEAGGVLLGRYIRGCRDMVIDSLSVPGPKDWRTRTSFYRLREHHQKAIDEAWQSSRGTVNYLGEWHTHPESFPTPSNVDIWDWRRRLQEDTFDSGSLLFLIVGLEQMRVWEGFRQTREFVEIAEEHREIRRV